MIRRRFLPFLLVPLLAVGFAPLGHAIDEVSAIRTSVTTGTPSQSEGLTFENTVRALTGFNTVGGSSYNVAASAPNALVQRSGTPAQSSVWYADGTGSNLAGVHQNAYGPLLRSNNLLAGSDNTFANGAGTAAGNIERLDFTWNTGFATLDTLAFAVFDRGGAAVHDGFTIAVVTGINATTGAPTSYGGFLKVAGNWGAATNPVGTFNYNLFRYAAGDTLTAATSTSEAGAQGLDGLVIKSTEFGLPAGTTIFGYSLMSGDVTPTAPNDLLNVNNTAVYSATTDGSTGSGGIDLAAVNGLRFQLIPEPSTWAMTGVGGLALLGVVVRRRRA